MDVKRIISELRNERQQVEAEILLLESSEWLEDRTLAFDRDGSSEQKLEHHFCELLMNFGEAVQQHDGMMANHYTSELKRLFRERAAPARRRLQSVAAAKDGN
jgi:hypothetical protein